MNNCYTVIDPAWAAFWLMILVYSVTNLIINYLENRNENNKE